MRRARVAAVAAWMILVGVGAGWADDEQRSAAPGSAERAGLGLTFYGWSDQHVSVEGGAEHVMGAVEALNAFPGTPLPEGVGGEGEAGGGGGEVAPPSFVIGCGDITEWPTHAARDAYDHIIEEELRWRAYDLIGNHDGGGKEPVDTMLDWVRERHGSLSYTFERGGVHFICAFSKFDPNGKPAQPLTDDALGFIQRELEELPEGTPAVVATHLCFDAITNRDELIAAFGDANVILVLGGHYHKAKVDHYRGYPFVQLPSPKDTTLITYLRITPDRVLAIPYDFAEERWITNPRAMLNQWIKGPNPSELKPAE